MVIVDLDLISDNPSGLQAVANFKDQLTPFWELYPTADIIVMSRREKIREAVAAYLDQFSIMAPLLLGVILVLQVIVAAIPGHALMVDGGLTAQLQDAAAQYVEEQVLAELGMSGQ